MATGQDGWYIAEPSGETTGPMSRAELTAQFQSGRHSAEALCWHVDVAEWHPLARVAGAGRAAGEAGQRAEPRATARAEARTEPRAEPRTAEQGVVPAWGGSSSAPAQAGEKRNVKAERKRMKREAMAKMAERFPDDGKRILSSAAAGAGGAAAAAAATSAAKATTAADKAKAGTEYVPVALRRLAARALDTAWLGIPAAALLWGVANRFFANLDTTVSYREPVLLALVLLAPLALVPLDAIATGLFGRTPGKALLGISVERRGGGRPGLLLGMRRAREVFVRGLGLGLPVVNLVTIVASGARLINHGATAWDERLGLATRTESLDARRTQIALGVLVGSWFLLTTEQFAGILGRLAAESFTWLPN